MNLKNLGYLIFLAPISMTSINSAHASPSECLKFEEQVIHDYALKNWDNNEDGCISEKEISKVRSIPTFAFGKKDIKTLNDLKKFPNLETIEESAFRNCTNLSVINLPQVKSIGDNAFMGTAAYEIKLPQVTKIGVEAFADTHPTPTKAKITYRFPKLRSLGNAAFARITPTQKSEATYILGNVPNETFKQNKLISKFEQQSGFNSIQRIGISAFEDSSVQDVVLTTETEILRDAFANSTLSTIASRFPVEDNIAKSPRIKALGDGAFKGTKITQFDVIINAEAFSSVNCNYEKGAICPGSDIFNELTAKKIYIDGTDLIWRQRGSYDLGNKYTTGVFDNVDTEEITLKVYPAEMKSFIQNAWSGNYMDKEWSSTKVVE